MRKEFKFALGAALATMIVPVLAYPLMTPGDEDPMAETLRDFGFVRVRLPSNLMNVGSLYYVDSGLKDFKTTCHASAAELEVQAGGGISCSREPIHADVRQQLIPVDRVFWHVRRVGPLFELLGYPRQLARGGSVSA